MRVDQYFLNTTLYRIVFFLFNIKDEKTPLKIDLIAKVSVR